MKNEMTKIAWAHFTFNLWHGCVKVDPACKNCYAETMSRRWKRDIWGVDKPRLFQKPTYYDSLQKWQADAEKKNVAYRVFTMSMGDLFEIHRDPAINAQMEERRQWYWEQIEQTPNLVHMLLTKRPENIVKLAPDKWKFGAGEYANYPDNVWLGTSIGTNDKVDRLLDLFLPTFAGGYFVSMEPLIEKPNKDLWVTMLQTALPTGSTKVALIAGGESGAGARRCDLQWLYDARDIAWAAGIYFFMKQTGSVLAKEMGLKHNKGEDITEWPIDLRVQNLPEYRLNGEAMQWGDK